MQILLFIFRQIKTLFLIALFLLLISWIGYSEYRIQNLKKENQILAITLNDVIFVQDKMQNNDWRAYVTETCLGNIDIRQQQQSQRITKLQQEINELKRKTRY